MGMSERRQRHRASLRREILDAASQLFVEEGYHRLTMRRLAERIEYSPTTIYLYFKDKNELLQAVCEETFSRLAAKLERLQKTAATPMGSLRDSLRTYIEFGLTHPNQYLVTFMSPSPGLDEGAVEGPVGSRAFTTLRAAVSACEASGDLHPADVDTTAQALWAAVHGLTSLLITQRGFPFAARAALVDHTIDTMIAGLKAPSAASRSTVSAQSKKWNYFD
jgi:AcrR family transcriptional regulator